MNTHERHELQKNELAKATEEAKHWLETDFYEKYGNHLLTAVSVGAILLAGWIYWSRTTTNREIAAWHQFTSASTPSEYRTISETYLGTRAAPWAKLKEAELALSDGVKDSFVDRESSKTNLDEAHTALIDLLAENPPAEIRERALYNLARCEEARCDGDVSKPIKAYETLLEEFKDTIYKPLAEERIATLKQPRSKEFYAWFAKQKPKPPVAPGPKDATEKPAKEGSSLPDLDFPLPAPSKPKTETKPEGEKPAENPAAPAETEKPAAKPETPAAEPKPDAKPEPKTEEKPAPKLEAPGAEPKPEAKSAEKPAEPAPEKPAEAKPAEPAPAAPATEKPAEEKPAEPAKP